MNPEWPKQIVLQWFEWQLDSIARRLAVSSAGTPCRGGLSPSGAPGRWGREFPILLIGQFFVFLFLPNHRVQNGCVLASYLYMLRVWIRAHNVLEFLQQDCTTVFRFPYVENCSPDCVRSCGLSRIRSFICNRRQNHNENGTDDRESSDNLDHPVPRIIR